jgi:hypothetical protein
MVYGLPIGHLLPLFTHKVVVLVIRPRFPA